MENKTYPTRRRCPNCGENVKIDVPKGTKVATYLRKKTVKCTNCEFRLE